MENRNEDATVRTYKYTKKKVLKDGTVKEYIYYHNREPKSDRVECGKKEIIRRITECKDKEKIGKINDLLTELAI